MKYLLWVKLPSEGFESKDEIDAFFKKEFEHEPYVRVMVTYGDIKVYLFGKPLFVYPYWLLKLKLWLAK